MQGCRGAGVQRCRGADVQVKRCRGGGGGAEVLKRCKWVLRCGVQVCRCAEVQRCRGAGAFVGALDCAQVQRCRGEEVQTRCTRGAEVQVKLCRGGGVQVCGCTNEPGVQGRGACADVQRCMCRG